MSDLLRDTQLAFDSVAAEYDGDLGNNALVQRMRAHLLEAVRQNMLVGNHLLDLGCGTGLDAKYLAQAGYRITAMDWSPQMIQRTKMRVMQAGLQDKVEVKCLGFHQLDEFESELLDGVYSDLGSLNCATDIDDVAAALFRILKSDGKLIVSVIGRVCPWEWILYSSKGEWARARVRFAPDMVSVPLNGRTVWTRYFMPREFENVFVRAGFKLLRLRSLALFVPPPYMIRFAERHLMLINFLQWLDDSVCHLPVFRNWGDHFLMVLKKNGQS